MRKLFVLGIMLAMAAGVAQAAPFQGHNTQKGSVLIMPDIDIRSVLDANQNFISRRQTIVRMQNDGSKNVWVKCYWLDGNKHRVDLQFELTANQPFWFDAATGDGTEPVTPYPNVASNGFKDTLPLGAGMLVCWVVDVEGTAQNKYNHLSATVTIYDHARGTAYEYTAYAFYANGGADNLPVGTPGNIKLDGVTFDSCPQYMIGQFTPQGVVTPSGITFGATRVVLAGCHIDLSQDWQPVWTKYQFDIWNEYENKVTGTYECADTWHELYLVRGGATSVADAASSNFDISAIGTFSARYRVQGAASDRCPQTKLTTAVPVLGIQSTEVSFANGTFARHGTNLTAAGRLGTGFIKWDIGFVTPEGGIR